MKELPPLDAIIELCNGVALLSNEEIIAVGGRNNAVYKFSESGDLLAQYGGEQGLGLGRLKEPVGAFVSNDDLVYVADWHNHRVVILDRALKYIEEFGHIGNVNRTSAFGDKDKCGNDPGAEARGRTSCLRTILSNLMSMAFTGSYLESHFNGSSQLLKPAQGRYSLRLLLEGIGARMRCHAGLRNWLQQVCCQEHWMNKPNGIAFHGRELIVSQKNSRCISVYDSTSPYALQKHIFRPNPGQRFGRLGNVYCDEKALFVCDERSGVIWKLNEALAQADEIFGASSGTEDDAFMPFSCCLVDRETLAVCGGRNWQLIDIARHEVLHVSPPIGELHGVAFDRERKRLYVADRLAGKILRYELSVHASAPYAVSSSR